MADCINRRTDSIMELMLDKRASTVQSIKIQTSPTLAGWTTRVTIPANNYPPNPGLGESWRGKVYYPFDLSTYSLTVPVYLRFVDVAAGIDTTVSDIYIATEKPRGNTHQYQFAGIAPVGAALANSIKINLPASSYFTIENTDGANNLAVAYNIGGSENILIPGETQQIVGSVSRIWIRGLGGTADFKIELVLKY